MCYTYKKVKEGDWMKLLITGGMGFIGSNFVRYILDKYPTYKVINVDALTYAGNKENLRDSDENPNHIFIKENILDTSKMVDIMKKYEVEVVINFAAETHVDRSIRNSRPFVRTNVEGTLSLIEAAVSTNIDRYIQISTDEVYGSVPEGYKKEGNPLNPTNPYAASKAGADLLVESYIKTFNLPGIITRCANNYGPHHFPEKLIPLLITQVMEKKELPIYGNGLQRRDWLHVMDHCCALDVVLHNGKIGEIYHIAGKNEYTNIEVAKLIVQKMNYADEKIVFVEDRLAHDFRYGLDTSKIEEKLGWKASMSFEEGLDATIEWYKENETWWKPLKR
jgi:dTDP-glucose 4,6-dehydratase